MPIYIVARCFSCEMFQVIQTKSKKFNRYVTKNKVLGKFIAVVIKRKIVESQCNNIIKSMEK